MLSSKRSVKMRRSHRTATQRKRRAWSISTARRPAIGKSAKRRGYRLWIRSETAPHDGHALFALIAQNQNGAAALAQRTDRAKPRGEQL